MRFIVVTVVVFLALGASGVQAMTCHDYVRANVLQDPDGMEEARRIIEPLAATGWGAIQGAPASSVQGLLYWRALTEQLQRECQQLPDETLDDIVVTHLRAVARQKEQAAAQAAEAAKKQAEKAAHYKAYAVMLNQVRDLSCRDYRSGGSKAALVVRFILAWSAVEDDNKEDPSSREAMHGAGAPELPRLNMTADQAKAGADKWCTAHPGAPLFVGAGSIVQDVYAATRLEKFGPEKEDSPATAAEKQRWAAEEAARNARWVREQAQASKAGPEGSCPYMMALMQQQGGRPSDESMASIRAQRVWDWCSAHPGATAAQLRAALPDR